MNILLDTNIIIPLEDTSKILDSSFAELRKLSAEQSHCLYIHPMQLEDINRDKNQERREIVLSRLKQYSQIENPPILSDQECHELGLSQSNDNDKVDNNVLFALYRGAAHLLVTIHHSHVSTSTYSIFPNIVCRYIHRDRQCDCIFC